VNVGKAHELKVISDDLLKMPSQQGTVSFCFSEFPGLVLMLLSALVLWESMNLPENLPGISPKANFPADSSWNTCYWIFRSSFSGWGEVRAGQDLSVLISSEISRNSKTGPNDEWELWGCQQHFGFNCINIASYSFFVCNHRKIA
jgi:hypothetical protein